MEKLGHVNSPHTLTSMLDPNSDDGGCSGRGSRGKYAKFTASMDVTLLEAMKNHNPYTAKHGHRLQMWQNVANVMGEMLFKSSDAYSWHTCRDRACALIRMYEENDRHKLFKRGATEENMKKEALLKEFSLYKKLPKSRMINSSGTSSSGNSVGHSRLNKRKRKQSGRTAGTNSIFKDELDDQESDVFRSRIIELMENKIQFDMDQRLKENAMREQEFELQKQFLEYLQQPK